MTILVEPETRIKDDDIKKEEEEEALTDYERFIEEEVGELLPAVVAEEAREDLVIPATVERVVPSKPTPEAMEEDACDETCPIIKEQKGEQC